MAGSESLTPAKLSSGVQALLLAHYAANGGRRPDVLVVYRDGVSEGGASTVASGWIPCLLAARVALHGRQHATASLLLLLLMLALTLRAAAVQAR